MHNLLTWFDSNKRDLPWRRSGNPYAIWVSEIMLQQTQVQTVIPYYLRWMERFPTVAALAQADEQLALSLWQGLGYYRRCRMLLQGARHVASEGIPACADEWRRVPGVGRYTAGAIASIALGERAPLVDGNVERVFARVTACGESGAKLKSAAWSWAATVLDTERPGDHNQALMELGATVCKPLKPLCHSCPLAKTCLANLTSSQDRYPSRKPRREIVLLDQIVWVPYCKGLLGVRQIPDGEWWQGMWEFPRRPAPQSNRIAAPGLCLGTINHVVTHHKIHLKVHFVELDVEESGLRWIDVSELSSLPLPAPQRRALELVQSHLLRRAGGGEEAPF